MTKLTTVHLQAPYLILIGDLADPTYAKTGQGIVDWRLAELERILKDSVS